MSTLKPKLTLQTSHEIFTKDEKVYFSKHWNEHDKTSTWNFVFIYSKIKSISKITKLLAENPHLTLGFKTYKEARERLNQLCKDRGLENISKQIIRQNTYIVKENPSFWLIKENKGWRIKSEEYMNQEFFHIFKKELEDMIFFTRREAVETLKEWFVYHKVPLKHS